MLFNSWSTYQVFLFYFILFQLNKFIVHFCKAIHLFVLISYDWLTRYSDSVIHTIWVTHRIAFDFSLFAHKLNFNFTFVWVFMFEERETFMKYLKYIFFPLQYLLSDIQYLQMRISFQSKYFIWKFHSNSLKSFSMKLCNEMFYWGGNGI